MQSPGRSRPHGPHFFPLALPFLLLLALALVLLFALVEVGVLTYAYEKAGIPHRWIFALLGLSLLGSYVNLPLAELPVERVVADQEVPFFGVRYVIPVIEERRTILAVNLGGAVVPALLSLHLLWQAHAWLRAAACIAIVAGVVHRLARPLPGIGIAVPIFLPAVLAAACASWFAPRSAPAIAYAAGSLGTLIGADLLNLRRLRGLGAPVASIGGAGTFDGIFVSGLLAVLLA